VPQAIAKFQIKQPTNEERNLAYMLSGVMFSFYSNQPFLLTRLLLFNALFSPSNKQTLTQSFRTQGNVCRMTEIKVGVKW